MKWQCVLSVLLGWRVWRSALCASLLLGGLSLPAAAATVNSPETWASGLAGWVRHDWINETVDSSLAVDNGSLKLVFPSQSMK